MSRTTGPQDVVEAARAARNRLVPACSPGAATGSRQDWADAVRELQALVDTATAAQDTAIVRLAALESEVAETGELVETAHAPGHVALDAAAVLSGALSVTAVHAERRVRSAVRLAADGPEGTATATGLGGLHAAMAAGHLDAYRAGVVAHELEHAPPEVCAAVVDGLADRFGTEDAPHLRRRVRRILARICPDLLRQRAVRARAECRLERWVDEPGVDTWHGTFPSEDAARAWAALDALAQRYVREGVRDDIGRARAKALIDLVTGNATIDVSVTLVSTAPEVERTGDARSRGAATTAPPASTPAATATATPIATATATAAAVAAPAAAAPATARDTAAGAGDLVQVRGLHPGEPVLVARRWLAEAVAGTRTSRDRRGLVVATAHPDTGALLDAVDELATDAYRPGTRLAALVRARDGHCRFPGCHVAARFCDLDHVVPWPGGRTRAANLVCLCRRHHRIKQRPGWTVRTHPDAFLTWTDPTGRRRTTVPVDHGDLVVLPDTGTDRLPVQTSPRRVLPDAEHSALEYALEHVLAAPRDHPSCQVRLHRPRAVRLSGYGRHRYRRPPPVPDDPPF